MIISRVIFKVTTSHWAILLVNSYLFVLVAYDLWTAFCGTTRLELIELRGEDVSDIVVAWACLLESRGLLLSTGRAPSDFENSSDEAFNSELARSGLLLLSLGLLIEIVTYFDFDAHTKMLSLNLSAIFNYLELFLMILLGMELLVNCRNIIQIKRTNA